MTLQKGQENLTLPIGVTRTLLAKSDESSYFTVTQSPSDGIVVKKLNDSDVVIWSKAFGSSVSYTPFGTYDEGDSVGWVSVRGVKVDSEGYLYVAGDSTASSSYWFLEEEIKLTGSEFKSTPFILKLDPSTGRLMESKNLTTLGDSWLWNLYADENSGYLYAWLEKDNDINVFRDGAIVQIDPIDLSLSRVISALEPTQARTKDGGFVGVLDLNQTSTQKTFNGQPLTGYGGEIALVKLSSTGKLE